MTKEILFRGFHKDENGNETIYIDGQAIKGKWVYGNLSNEHSKTYIFDTTNGYLDSVSEVIPETIGQYINRLDTENAKIFEGCKCKHFINVDFVIAPEGVVEYLDDRYILRYSNTSYTDFMFIKSKDILIIGTKFDKEVE